MSNRQQSLDTRRWEDLGGQPVTDKAMEGAEKPNDPLPPARVPEGQPTP
jgi:hypothetical protein